MSRFRPCHWAEQTLRALAAGCALVAVICILELELLADCLACSEGGTW